ncbi:choline/ethanolaminephosphotransferase 1 bbc isoform X3 [Rhodnius prolixus]|uniref:choline/ethanolaminephosphotransferase 1 bbc isoform X3 n=1 Tax=Rhodnius prolixus TaxID=13249 RepID=UPI003D189AF0
MFFYKEKILSPGQLKRLSDHKYSCESLSILDKFLQPWWDWLVSKIPLWLAPNLITIIGLIINILTTLVLVYYSPDAKAEAPWWAFILCALGLFAYQSLDAIDGKQARRTGTSTPLGELFDHGCDSVSTVFVAISACIAVQLGSYPSWMFFQCFCAITLFYCAHWQAYVSGTLRFGRVDVTEAQFTIMGIHLISAFFGPEIWSIKVPAIGILELRHLIFLLTIICCSVPLYQLFIDISNGGVGKNGSTVAIPWLDFDVKQCQVFIGTLLAIYLFHRTASVVLTGGIGKNGSSVAGTSVLSPVIPLSLVVVPAFIICRKSTEHVYENHPVLYILAFGLVAAKVTNRLVVAHMTRNEMDYFDSSLIGPAMLFLNQYFNFFIPEHIVLWICLIWVCFDLIRYSRQVCLEICDHMRIHLFKIVPSVTSQTIQQTSNKNVTQDIKDVTFALSEDGTPLLDPDDDEFVIYDASLA